MQRKNDGQQPDCTFCEKPLSIRLLNNIYRSGMLYDVLECYECQIAMLHPFPSDNKISEFYSAGNYRTDEGTRFKFLIEYLIYLGSVIKRRRIEKYSQIGKIIDIGCGRGLFLDVMRRGGWDTVGSELNKETASYAEHVYGLKVHAGDIAEKLLPVENFDVVNICGVLEHLKEPDVLLSETHRLLKKEGLLVILVPDIRSLEFKIGRENWFHLDLPHHLFHFTEEGLVSLLERKGFKVREVKRFHLEYSPFGWLQTLLNISKIRFNLFYDLLKSENLKRNTMRTFDLKGIVVTLLLMPLYLPIAFICSILEPILFKRGGIIQVYASKEKQ